MTNRIHSGSLSETLCAALAVRSRLPDLESAFSEKVLDEADSAYPGGVALGELMQIAAVANGMPQNFSSRMTLDTQRYAMCMMGGFSAVNTPAILSNIANKFFRRGWDAVDMTPLKIAAIRSVNDFKTTNTYSLVGNLEFQKVGPDGEIKHGELGETVYENKADTYARMLAITRVDLINDDLGSLSNRSQQLGRGAGLSLNTIFWRTFLNNAAFFNAGNNNVAAAALNSAGLEVVDGVFTAQLDPNGDPMGLTPKILLVPPALKTRARTLVTAEKLKGNEESTDANPWEGRFEVESSPYMASSKFTGASQIAWYMLADPEEMPVIEIAALYGKVEPTIESAEANFNVLGIQMRGYSDVGVELQEPRGGVRSNP